MNLVLGLHVNPTSYSDRWVEYCRERGVPFREVDPFRPDFIQQVEGLKAFAWLWAHDDPRAVLMARQVTCALEAKGLKVFPNSATCWHYDDKVGQKYLLEAIGAPLVPSHVFYDREIALRWVERTSFPKVFKLRKGSSSNNVRLVRSAREARGLVNQAFRGGFNPVASHFSDWQAKLALHRQHGETSGQMVRFAGILRRLPRSIRAIARTNYLMQKERGYAYFQDFIPGNLFDTRVTVIGHRAFGSIRFVRKGDFRASGSGHDDCSPEQVDLGCVRIAIAVARKIGAQALSFDFVFGPGREPLIVEISYACPPYSIYNCPGHWDDELRWHEGHMFSQDAILEDLLVSLRP
jgi:glutathione synthase/RimK-type ligase-like ATP-grasp enzyme